MQKRIKIYNNLFNLDFDWRFVFFKWLPALRSGDYKQGHHYLCRLVAGVKRYCCLGVGSNLCGFEWIADDDAVYAIAYGTSLERCLSHKFAHRVGLADELGSFKDSKYGCRSLAVLNDSRTDFFHIADIIERHARARFIERYHPKHALKRFFQKCIYGASSDSLDGFVKE